MNSPAPRPISNTPPPPSNSGSALRDSTASPSTGVTVVVGIEGASVVTTSPVLAEGVCVTVGVAVSEATVAVKVPVGVPNAAEGVAVAVGAKVAVLTG